MGKKNNVNPNHYKTAGRDRPGDNLLQQEHRHALTQAQAELRRTGSVMIIDVPPVQHMGGDAGEDAARLEEQQARAAGNA